MVRNNCKLSLNILRKLMIQMFVLSPYLQVNKAGTKSKMFYRLPHEVFKYANADSLLH